MATRIEINTEAVVGSIRAQSLKGKKKLHIAVGYEAPYAVYVHENLTARHVQGQAKFLEVPARRLRGRMGKLVAKSIRQKKSLESGMQKAANLLMQESEKLVPVDTGFLRLSAYARVESSTS